MRLICPNCGAQYEVPDEVIPESGRDVQCSDCGNTWFQHHPDFKPVEEPEHEPEADWDDPDDAELGDTEPDASKDASVAEIRPAQSMPEIHDQNHSSASVEEQNNEPIDTPELTGARQLDPSVAEVLREEAALEERARAADRNRNTGLETQQEMGLSASDPATSSSEINSKDDHIARLRGEGPEGNDGSDDVDLDDQASRRNLLPDIDEINSSLGPDQTNQTNNGATPALAAVTKPPKSGFKLGFRMAVLLALFALLAYVFSPKIAELAPALAEPLSHYTNAVDTGRTALDGILANFANSLSDN